MLSSVKCTAKRSKSEPVIHSLPEGIMHDIVSRLTLKDAARASLVSTNWRQLWTFHSNLCFDSPTILNREYGTISRSSSRRGRRRRRFIRRVNAILESHSGARLRRFGITFALDARHTQHLDRWLKFALDSRASEIAVNLFPVFYKGSLRSYEWEDAYTLPSHMFSSQGASYIESLQLVFASLKLPRDFYGPVKLRVLDLQSVHVSEGDLELLLSKCSALECLRLGRCYPVLNLKVQKPLCRLRNLSVQRCQLQVMECSAPNLAKFEYSGQAIPITLGESMKPTEATVTLLGYDDTLEYVFTELPKTLSRVVKFLAPPHQGEKKICEHLHKHRGGWIFKVPDEVHSSDKTGVDCKYSRGLKNQKWDPSFSESSSRGPSSAKARVKYGSTCVAWGFQRA